MSVGKKKLDNINIVIALEFEVVVCLKKKNKQTEWIVVTVISWK